MPHQAVAVARPVKLPVASAAAASPLPGIEWAGVWNWGAFLLNPFWLMNHGRPWRGTLVLICNFLPPLNLISLAVAITYGSIGNRVAASARAWRDERQFVAVQNAWRDWGFWMTGIALALFVLSLILEAVKHPA
jgi:hypothetical protein